MVISVRIILEPIKTRFACMHYYRCTEQIGVVEGCHTHQLLLEWTKMVYAGLCVTVCEASLPLVGRSSAWEQLVPPAAKTTKFRLL